MDEALKPLLPLLKKPKVRQIMERETPDEASSKIVERLHKEETKKTEKTLAAQDSTVAKGPAEAK